MGEMKQMWKLTDIKQRLKPVREGKYKEEEMIDALFGIGTDMARKAKSEHDYHNIKGQLESSVGVVIVKNRRELVRWSVLATSGSDPAWVSVIWRNAYHHRYLVNQSFLTERRYRQMDWLVLFLQQHHTQQPFNGEIRKSCLNMHLRMLMYFQ